MHARIALENASFHYLPGRPVFEHLTLRVTAGEVLCLLGPNGTGKSTLIKCMGGLLRPQDGGTLLDGKPLAGLRPAAVARLVGYVPQQLERLGGLWHAPLPDYSRPGEPPAGLPGQSLWYIVCAVVGMALVVGLSLLLGRWLARHEQSTTDMDE